MAHVSTVVLCVVFCITIGSTWCLKECTETEVQKCSDITNDYGHCRWFSDILKCMDNIKSCTDDTLRLYLTSARASLHARTAECPGIRNGSCFEGELRRCEKMVPYGEKYQIDHTTEGKTKYCPHVLSLLPKAKDCIVTLKGQCDTEHTDRAADLTLKALDQLELRCDGYAKESGQE